MPEYEPAAFWRLTWISLAGAALFWFFSVLGEERGAAVATPGAQQIPAFRETWKAILGDVRTRRYALFLGASAFFAFMQDSVLEPFGGDVFGLSVGETTRFNAYWGVGVLIGMLATMAFTRRWPPDRQVRTTAWGLVALGIPILVLAWSSFSLQQALVVPTLVFFGLGFGVFTVGGVSLLMAMSREQQAGSYLALWSMIQLILRGSGIALGGVLRDLALAASGSLATAYAFVFLVEGLGLIGCVALLRRVDVAGFVDGREGKPAAWVAGVPGAVESRSVPSPEI
jgi:BCD family chlorophyll transporter-like MFS transporter